MQSLLTHLVLLLGVPAYLWTAGCGPTSAGMLLGYYDGRGYPALVDGSAAIQNQSVNATIGELAEAMGVFMGGATMSGWIDDGLSTVIQEKGYTAPETQYAFMEAGAADVCAQTIYRECTTSLENGLGMLRSELDASRPLILGIDTNANGISDHAVLAWGYGYDAYGQMWVVTYNTWSREPVYLPAVLAAPGINNGLQYLVTLEMTVEPQPIYYQYFPVLNT